MLDDDLRELFEQAARMPVQAPRVEQIVARARQRRRRVRLQVSAVGWTVLLAAGFGAPQAAGDLVRGSIAVRPAPPRTMTLPVSTAGPATPASSPAQTVITSATPGPVSSPAARGRPASPAVSPGARTSGTAAPAGARNDLTGQVRPASWTFRQAGAGGRNLVSYCVLTGSGGPQVPNLRCRPA